MTKNFENLARILDLKVPIMQAPIGSLATCELVSEVARAGGIGGLALTWTESRQAAEQVRKLKQQTENRFFVNYVMRFPTPSLDEVLEQGVPVVTLSWGIDESVVKRIQATGAKVGVQVGHPEGGKLARAAGADFIIAQSMEAGGHVQSTMALKPLLSGLLETGGDLPIVAAGGISTAHDVKRVMDSGAAAAMLGTRFAATIEANAHQTYKQALVESTSADTAFTNCFDIDWPYAMVRVLRNKTLSTWEAAGCPAAPNRPGEGDKVALQNGKPIIRYSDSPPLRSAVGNPLEACLYAGAGVGEINEIMPAFELVGELSKFFRTAQR
jgi:nitronate monooxygenase